LSRYIKKVISLEKEKTAREHIENIVNTMGETLIVVDPKGEVKSANKTTFDLLGYGEEFNTGWKRDSSDSLYFSDNRGKR